mgnify:CR=1 FL=1
MSFELDFRWYGEEETCPKCGRQVGIATDRQYANLEKSGYEIRAHICIDIQPFDCAELTELAIKNGINPSEFNGCLVLQILPSGLAITTDESNRGTINYWRHIQIINPKNLQKIK